MCFSASASFAASGLLIGASWAAHKSATSPADKTLSFIPGVFGIQQAIEGVLWLALENGEYNTLIKSVTIAFLAIAWVVWPIFIPWVFSKFTFRPISKKINTIIFFLGLTVGTYNAFSLATVIPYSEIDGNHILYRWHEFREYGDIIGVFYVTCALIPPFLTSNRKLMILGSVHAIMFAFSYIFMTKYLISVWCFLAAVSSIIIFAIIYSQRKSANKINK